MPCSNSSAIRADKQAAAMLSKACLVQRCTESLPSSMIGAWPAPNGGFKPPFGTLRRPRLSADNVRFYIISKCLSNIIQRKNLPIAEISRMNNIAVATTKGGSIPPSSIGR